MIVMTYQPKNSKLSFFYFAPEHYLSEIKDKVNLYNALYGKAEWEFCDDNVERLNWRKDFTSL